MHHVVVARDLEKSFGSGQRRTPILRGVTLEVARGEIVFLVGPSGSGKTTLLSILGCLMRPEAGSIEVMGTDVSRLNIDQLTTFRRHNLGFVFQTFNLFPNLSALDNIQLALCMRQVPAGIAKQRSLELLNQVGLSARARLRPAQLSTGECQRVALARALAGEPALLLADEPTASLDGENGQAVMHLLHRLVQDRGVSLIIVTHDTRILPFADRILRLEDGQITGEELPEETEALQNGFASAASAPAARMHLREERVA
jgi:putative ABC transport system ATP-binding protein